MRLAVILLQGRGKRILGAHWIRELKVQRQTLFPKIRWSVWETALQVLAAQAHQELQGFGIPGTYDAHL